MSTIPTFYVFGGKTLHSFSDLKSVLPNITDDIFAHHVNDNKNDFATWIENGLGDKKLAQAIKKVKTRKGLIKKLETL